MTSSKIQYRWLNNFILISEFQDDDDDDSADSKQTIYTISNLSLIFEKD